MGSSFSYLYIINSKQKGRKGVGDLSATIVITIMISLIILLLTIGAPVKPTRLLAQSIVKLGIGVLFLFFFNVFGGSLGLHIPINLFTVVVSGFLGLPGLASLAAMQIFLV